MSAADIAAVVTIEGENYSPWSFESIVDELGIHGGVTLVVVSPSGKIQGWCSCRSIAPEAELLKIAVRSGCRQSGLGTLLLEKLIVELSKNSIDTLLLEVRANNVAAIDFYLKNGFKNVGVRSGYYQHPTDDALLLQKNL